MNKLDGKCIVDRDLFRALYLLARNSDTGKLREADAATCRELWNQDLTGWAAVPTKPTEKMVFLGANCLPDSVCEWEACALETYWAMLAASPPLPTGEQK